MIQHLICCGDQKLHFTYTEEKTAQRYPILLTLSCGYLILLFFITLLYKLQHLKNYFLLIWHKADSERAKAFWFIGHLQLITKCLHKICNSNLTQDKTVTVVSVSPDANPSDANHKFRKTIIFRIFSSSVMQSFPLLLETAGTKAHVCCAFRLLHFMLQSLDGTTRMLYCIISKKSCTFPFSLKILFVQAFSIPHIRIHFF